MWSGNIASIPTCWHLTDGSSGTTDLRNRFVVGADADNGGVAKSTIYDGVALQTGGSKTHTHTTTVSVYTAGGLPAGSSVQSGTGYSSSFSTNGGGGGMSSNPYIGGALHDVVPPFYALAYIQRTC